jgi:hypothetical protein
MGIHYIQLNKKIDNPQDKHQQQTKTARNVRQQQQFFPRVQNLTNIKLDKEEIDLLNLGL